MNTNLTNYKEDEIGLVDLFFACLFKWKMALFVGIIFSILFGIYHYYSYNNVLSDEGKTKYMQEVEDYELNREQYEHTVSAYKQDLVTGRNQIKLLEEEIENKEKYIAKSPKMELDAFNYYTWSLSIYVDTDYKIMPSMTYQDIDRTGAIVKAYINAFSSNEFRTELAARLGVDILYLWDVYSLSSDDEGYIYVGLIGDSEEFVRIGNTFINEKISSVSKELKENIENHSIQLTDFGVSTDSSNELLSFQEMQHNDLLFLNNSLSESKNNLSDLKEPEKFTESRPSTLSHTPKMIVIGFALGVILVSVITIMRVIVGKKVLSARELEYRYDIALLGKISYKHYIGLSKLFRKWGKCSDLSNIEHDCTLIDANYVNVINDSECQILITGVGNQRVLLEMGEKIKGKLNVGRIEVGESMFMNPSTVKMLPKCDGVILLEECNKSSYDDIDLEIKRITSVGKNIIGFVIIE